MPDILITENIEGPAVQALDQRFEVSFEPDIWQDPSALMEKVRLHRAIIVRNQTRVTRELIRSAPRLRVIGRSGAGLDNINVTAATEAGIVVAYTPEQNSISVAELTLGMMLALARHIPPADRDIRAGGWNRQRFTGVELHGKTLGIVGLGRIGFRTARRARAFGMEIIAHDGYANPDGVTVSELRTPLLCLEEVLERSDFISCHLPLTPLTRNIFDYEKFSLMKPGAYFINTSRGEVVDEAGLLRALEQGKLAGAGLDVRQKEPPVADAFRNLDNVIMTPHIAAFTTEGQQRVTASVCRDVTAVLTGKPAGNFANFAMPQN